MENPLKVLVIMFIFLSACGLDPEESTDRVIESAEIFLTNGNCQAAIDILENHGRQNFDVSYLQTLASAYACRAGVGELDFIQNNVPLIGSTSTSFIGSLTRFTTSPMSAPDDSAYVDLKTAVDILLYAGSVTTPSTANRLGKFTSGEVGDMNVQLLMLLVAQLGKYAFYYGNANPTAGVKGTGSAANGNSNGDSNTCFMTYTHIDALNLINDGDTGSCTNLANTGHTSIQVGNGAIKLNRVCQGIVLFNNLLDVLLNTTLPSQAGNLTSIGSALSTAFDAACSISTFGNICTEKSQSSCEALYATSLETTVQFYMAGVFENLFI